MPQVGDIFRVVLYGKLMDLVETRNMFTYKVTTAVGSDVDVAEGAEDGVYDIIAAKTTAFTPAWTIYQTECQKWYPAVGANPGYWLGFHTTSRSFSGTGAGDMSAFQAAILLLFKTAARRVVGRKFLAGLSESNTSNGFLTSALLADMADLIIDLMADLPYAVSGVIQPGVKDKLGQFHPFLSGTVGAIISSMRRRKPGYGI